MDPLSVSLGLAIAHFIATHAVAVAVVSVAAITLVGLGEWFRAREQLLEDNKDTLAFTLSEMINSKRYVEVPGLFSSKAGSTRLVQGIYDQKAKKILDMRAVTANKIDSEIAAAHGRQSLVIYPR